MYDPIRDSTFLRSALSGYAEAPYQGFLLARFPGRGPSAYPGAQLTLLLPGSAGARLLALSTPPLLTLMVDDTLRLNVGPTRVGSYRGPLYAAAVAPISVVLSPASLLVVARAAKVDINLDGKLYRMHDTLRYGAEAVLRTALCGPIRLSFQMAPAARPGPPARL